MFRLFVLGSAIIVILLMIVFGIIALTGERYAGPLGSLIRSVGALWFVASGAFAFWLTVMLIRHIASMEEREDDLFFIGVYSTGKVADYNETRKQIERVEKLKLDIRLRKHGAKLDWSYPQNLFEKILKDRQERVDQDQKVDTRPCFCVITARGHKAIRLQHYEGQYELKLANDVRSPCIQGKELGCFIDYDPLASEPDIRYTHPEVDNERRLWVWPKRAVINST